MTTDQTNPSAAEPAPVRGLSSQETRPGPGLSPEQARDGLIERREVLGKYLAEQAEKAKYHSDEVAKTKAEIAETDRWIRAATPRKSPIKKVKPNA